MLIVFTASNLFIPFSELHAFAVECEFTETEGRTVIRSVDWNENGFTFPNTEKERCTDPNCFSHIFEYPASNEQIKVRVKPYESNVNNAWLILKALIGQSSACKQKIKHVCSINSLTNLSSWTGRNGVKHTYWSGDRNPTDKGIRSSLNKLLCNSQSL